MDFKPQINYEDFSKLDLRVGKVKEVFDIEGADKLYKIMVDVGLEESIQILSGIKEFFTKEELIEKTIIVLVNLEPRTMRGEVSNGMLLAVGDEKDINLLTTQNPSTPGQSVN